MAAPALPRRLVRTDDPQLAQSAISELFGAPMTLTADPPAAFRYDMAAVVDDSMSAASTRFTGSCRSGAEEFSDFIVAHAANGRHRWRIGSESGSGEVPFLVPPGREFRVEFTRLHLRSVNIDRGFAEQVVRSLTGSDRPTLRFDGVNDGAAGSRLMSETLRYVEATLIAEPTLAESPLVRAQMARQVVVAMLATFPVVPPDLIRDATLRTRSVRRAVAFLEEHAAEAITVGDVALAAGVSTRALQAAFQRSFETTPTAYLRRLRLDGAHRDLLAGEPGTTTVHGVAARWGFAHTGRFARQYTTAFGEHPSHTLRR